MTSQQEMPEDSRLEASSKNQKTTQGKPKTAQKYHHFTVCMVPHKPLSVQSEDNEHAEDVARDFQGNWETLKELRCELRDPGFYRWPPHANLLYPFINPFAASLQNASEIASGEHRSDHIASTGEETSQVNITVVEKLKVACQSIEPFCILLEKFGTFGDSNRGVLWLYPKSISAQKQNLSIGSSTLPTEPLIALQEVLQSQFPMCTEQRKIGGAFRPHITIGHFPSVTDAQAAQEQCQQKFQQESDSEEHGQASLQFLIEEIYLLHRRGDEGQFERLVSVPLGSCGAEAIVHTPPKPFDGMPLTEDTWVYEERQKQKRRRNRKGRRRHQPSG